VAGRILVVTSLSPQQRILIVEHDEVTAETYARILTLAGYTVVTTLSAEAGLREAESRPPNVIIVDFHMPDVDGLEFLRRLRLNDANFHTPVAVVTGDYFVDDATSAAFKRLGAEVRFKPLWVEDLEILIQALIHPTDRTDSP